MAGLHPFIHCSFCFLALLASCLALGKNWQAFIDPTILEQYSGHDQQDRFSSDLFEGDIMGITLTDEQNAQDVIKSQTKNVFIDSTARWPAGPIAYNISDKFSAKERKSIVEAMRETSVVTGRCIQFVPRTIETDFLNFLRGFGCFSSVGYQGGGEQVISLRPGCLESTGLIQHVLMHALGFYHENSRINRDEFVELNEKNILDSDNMDNFLKYTNINAEDFPYDVESITHYPFNVFAVDSKLPTIVPKKGKSRIGQTAGLSHFDLAKISAVYGCQQSGTTARLGRGRGRTQSADVETSTSVELDQMTPDAPDIITGTPVLTTSSPIPKFRMGPITPQQCLALNTENCRILPQSKNCTTGYGYIADCNADASTIEIQYFFTKIQRLNASRGIEVTIHGVRTYAQETFAPIVDILIILIVADSPGFELSNLRSLTLPIITHIGLVNCSNVVIKQDDLLFYPKLTMFMMAHTTVGKIENGAFDSLPHLREVSFDTGYKANATLSRKVMANLQLLHCDCEYSWLRAFLRKYPYLIDAKRAGQVHRFGGIVSHPAKRQDLYIAVDCAKPGLIGNVDQTEFSINSDCPDHNEVAGAFEG